MQIWAGSGTSALPICNSSQILYQFLTFTQNLKRSPGRAVGRNVVWRNFLCYSGICYAVFYIPQYTKKEDAP